MCAWLAAAGPAAAQAPAPGEPDGSAMEFRLRIAGQPGQARVREVTPLPFALDFKAGAADAGPGVVEIVRLPDPDVPDDAERLLHRSAVELTAGKRERITGFLPLLGHDAEQLEARWIRDGEVQSRSLSGVHSYLGTAVAVWVATDKPAHARRFDSVPNGADQWLAEPVELEALPRSWVALRGADCLVVDRLRAPDTAAAGQWRPVLRQWVETGGLVVVTGATDHAVLKRLLGDMLPVSLLDAAPVSTSPQSVFDALGAGKPAPAERFRPAVAVPGAVVLAAGDAGVHAAYRDIGLGRVLWLGCALEGKPQEHGYVGGGAVALALAAHVDDLRHHPIPELHRGSRGRGWGPAGVSHSASLDAAAESISVPAPPRSGLLTGVVAWALFLATLFAVARFRGRLGLAWSVAVAGGVVGFLGLSAWAQLTFAGRAAAASLTVSVGALGAPQATSVQGSALYVPAAVAADLQLGPEWPALLSPLDTKLEPAITTLGEGGAVARARLASRSTQRFRGFGRLNLGGGIALVNWERASRSPRESFQVRNDAPFELTDVLIHLPPARFWSDGRWDDSEGARVFLVRRLPAGATVTPEPAGVNGEVEQALRGRFTGAAGAEPNDAESQLARAVLGFAVRARSLSIALNTAVLTATPVTPPAALRIDGAAVPTVGPHLLVLFAAPPPPPERTSDLGAGALLGDPAHGAAVARSRMSIFSPFSKWGRRALRGKESFRAATRERLVQGIELDVHLTNLADLPWNRSLAFEVWASWDLASHHVQPQWRGVHEVADASGTIEVLGIRDVYSGAWVALPKSPRVVLPCARRFQSEHGIALRVKFTPPRLPTTAEILDQANPPAPVTWNGALRAGVTGVEVEGR